jgi:hypothetical protein
MARTALIQADSDWRSHRKLRNCHAWQAAHRMIFTHRFVIQ